MWTRGCCRKYRKAVLSEAEYEHDDEQLLYRAGALTTDDGGRGFTNAGVLFFASNPQRVRPSAHVRLLRFDCGIEEAGERGLPTLDKKFTGPVTKQIRDLRTFFRESAFFKTYERRRPGGGFIEEPEYPLIAVDEAIVNAVAHRDYAMGVPIVCESYKDVLVVHNPGRVQQIDRDVPDRFSLEDTTLESTPRNPALVEWLKDMKDNGGRAFVRALSEGTKRMRDEMEELEVYRLRSMRWERLRPPSSCSTTRPNARPRCAARAGWRRRSSQTCSPLRFLPTREVRPVRTI
jgi:predicted HTH transcriptional regulator